MSTTDKILHAIDLAEPPVIGAGVGHLIGGPFGLAAGAAVGGVLSLCLGVAKWYEHLRDEEEKKQTSKTAETEKSYPFWQHPAQPQEPATANYSLPKLEQH